jgi:hypothetical protein
VHNPAECILSALASAFALHANPTCFNNQAQQTVGIENKVGGGGGAVTDDGVHSADLEVAGDDLQVVEDAPQVVLLQLQHGNQVRRSAPVAGRCWQHAYGWWFLQMTGALCDRLPSS